MKKLALVFISLFAFASCKDEKVIPANYAIDATGLQFEDAASNSYLFNSDNVVVNSIAYPLGKSIGGNYVSPAFVCDNFYIQRSITGNYELIESDGDVLPLILK